MKNTSYFLISLLFTSTVIFSQPNNSDGGFKNMIDTFIMTWDKNTPEQEMKDDIKAFAEQGVTVKYNNVKRNDRNEIVAINVSYETKIGEKGSLSYDNIKPIGTIKIYKLANEVGFGEAPNFSSGVAFSSSVPKDDMLMNNYNFTFPNEKSTGPRTLKSILRTGKQPLIIENGKVIEGGSDYTSEELNEILKSTDDNDIFGNGEFKSFNYKGNQDFSEEIKKMQEQIDELMKRQKNAEQNNSEKSNNELKEEKKEVEKTKSTLKVKKA